MAKLINGLTREETEIPDEDADALIDAIFNGPPLPDCIPVGPENFKILQEFWDRG